MSVVDKYVTESNYSFSKLVIKKKIEDLISPSHFADIDEFLKYNPSIEEFTTNNRLDNVIRNHGYNMNNNDYISIIDEIKSEEVKRKQIITDNITTTNIDDKKIITYKSNDEQIVLEDSYSNLNIEDQLMDLQHEQKEFRNNGEENVDNMITYMRDNIKIEPQLHDIDEERIHTANNEQTKIAEVAREFLLTSGKNLKIDFEKKLLLGDDGEIYSIEKRDGMYGVYLKQEGTQKEKVASGKQLIKRKLNTNQAAFADALFIAFTTGVIASIAILNIYVRVINNIG